jgi:hypothetical protein
MSWHATYLHGKKKRNVGFMHESVSSVLAGESKEAEDARIAYHCGFSRGSRTSPEREHSAILDS